MKRKLCLLAAALAFALGMPVMAEEVTWSYDSSNQYLRMGGEPSGEVTIPSEADGYEVKALGYNILNDKSGITSVILPDTVEALQSSSIAYIDTLESVQLSEQLVAILSGNFSNCPSLTSVTIPASVKYIEASFYWNDNLREIRFEGPCPVFTGNDWTFSGLPDDCIIYVPDDQLDAYAEALSGTENAVDKLQPSGQNAIISETAMPEEDFAFDAASGTITQYLGNSACMEIPETIGGVPVKSIGDNAFARCYYLYYLTIPEGVETVGNGAFAHDSNIGYISLPSTLCTVGEEAFFNTQARCISWSEGLEEIGARAFSYERDSVLELPSTVRSIGESAFEGSGISELYLSNNVKSIGSRAFADSAITYMAFDFYEMIDLAEDAFSGCPVADLDLPWDSSFENKNAYVQILAGQCPDCTVWINNPPAEVAQYPENITEVTTITDGVWTVYNGDAADLTVWTAYDGIPVTTLGDGIFKGNQSIRSFYPHHCEWFTTIGNEAFADSSVEYVELFGSITTIGDGAFRNCVNIKELTIPASVTSIGAGAFEGCTNLEKVTILCDAALVGEGAFAGCASLTDVYIEKGDIPADCFADSGLVTVSIGEGVTSVGDRAFANTQIAEMNLYNLTGIGASAFENTLLTEATFSDSLTAIGDNAFAGTGITRIVIPAQLEVNTASFAGIQTEEIRMSDAATDEQLAAWNEAFETPWYNPLIRESEESSFVKMPYVPTPEEYFEIDESTGTITEYTGTDVDVVIPRSIGGVEVKSIGYGAFACAEDYTDIEMDTNQEDWLHLRSLVIPETVTSISDSAFNYCQQLETVICYGPLETTGKGTFHYCRSLKNVVFVNGVKVLDNYLFEFCRSLTNVWYKGTLDMIGEDCFRDSGLETFVIDAKQVGNVAFRECTSLKEIHVRGGVESVVKSAFQGCTSLADICFEFCDPGVFDDGDAFTGECAPGAMMRIPSAATDDEAARFFDIWKKGNLGPIEDESHIVREDCTIADPEKPDVKELMAVYNVTYDNSMEESGNPAEPSTGTEAAPAENAPEPATEAAPAGNAPEPAAEAAPAENVPEPATEAAPAEIAAGMDSYLERKFICKTADVSGYTIDASALGAEYSILFHSDGSTQFVLAGTAVPGLTWTLEKVQTENGEADAFVIIYFDGTPLNYVITDAGFDLNFFDSMLMHFEPEA
ncbi:MAG: leucine-rich repeat protein [Candidatus Choladocola sp.]|nr:leucine-rich repeat protein [Candidatus Choladocola sp.]